jgi:hypothetical protein
MINTEIFYQINWLAVIVATLAYFILGALWYSKILFGNKWAKLINLDTSHPDSKKGMGKMMIGSFLLMAITAIGLAILVVKFNVEDHYSFGIKLGLVTSLFFSSTAVGINYIYENRPFGILFINNGYHILGHIVAAIILVMWR